MKKLFISIPMRGLSKDEILKNMNFSKCEVEKQLGEKVELIQSYMSDCTGNENGNRGLYFLGKSLELLSQADLVYFAKGWENARGCIIEHIASKGYGINILNIEERTNVNHDSHRHEYYVFIALKDLGLLQLKFLSEKDVIIIYEYIQVIFDIMINKPSITLEDVKNILVNDLNYIVMKGDI